jgi:dephospho-CoA kinase
MYIIGLCGLPGAGKSYIADQLEKQYGCKVIRKVELCQRAHRESGSPIQDWRVWLDLQYREQTLESVTSLILDPFLKMRDKTPRRTPIVLDSIHNTQEWNMVQKGLHNLLVCVTAPRHTRVRRSEEKGSNEQRDRHRIEYAHETDDPASCLFARADWSIFNGDDYFRRHELLKLSLLGLFEYCMIGTP